MIITRTPLRVSFFGGGTDYPAYYLRHGGATLATTVDKYAYVTLHPLAHYFDHSIRVHYSKVESVRSLDEIWVPNVREALRLLDIKGGVEIHLVSDLPARTGLGSSSATTVGLLKALYGYKGEIVGNEELARQAVHVEQNMIGEPVGSQDQYICALGGLLKLEFLRDGTVRYEPVTVSNERLEELSSHLMMMYTGLQRNAYEVLDEQVKRTNEGALDRHLALMRRQVDEAIAILSRPVPIRQFGELLHTAWELKRSLSSKISNPWIDQQYQKARSAGAVGGKLLGAGGGGFLLLFVEPDRQLAVRAALPGLQPVEFRFEPNGVSVIFYDRDRISGAPPKPQDG